MVALGFKLLACHRGADDVCQGAALTIEGCRGGNEDGEVRSLKGAVPGGEEEDCPCWHGLVLERV